MAKGKLISALDIGTSKITTLIAQVRDPESDILHIVGVASVGAKGVRKGQIVNIEEAVVAITESVEAAERMAGFNIAKVLVSVGGSHIVSQNSHGVVAVSEPRGEINAEDVRRVLEAARAISLPTASEIVHVVPRAFNVDSQEGVNDPTGMTSGWAVLSDTEKELGVILADIGGGTTSIAMFTEGALSYSSVLPVGAKNVTNDLAIGLRISLESAEKIKLHLSSLKNKDDEVDLSSLHLPEELKTVSYKTRSE